MSIGEREQFYFERDKRRFVAGRGLLRLILGHYLYAEPSQWGMYYGRHGKPYLTGEFDECAFGFSLAHSHEITIYALSLGEDIGVDLEHTRILRRLRRLHQHYFQHEKTLPGLGYRLSRSGTWLLCLLDVQGSLCQSAWERVGAISRST